MKIAISLLLTLAAALPLLAENTPAELRQTSKAVLGTIPDKMPGSESDTPDMVELGRTLFFDVRLSANNTQSCNSCHAIDQQRGGADTAPTSLGDAGKHGGRNAPTVLNAGFHVAQFWDGRAADLAAQTKGPILNPVEMGMHGETAVLEKLNAVPGYGEAFAKAFPKDAKPLTYDNLARAIAAFEHTLITHDRFDDFLKGEDGALNDRERKGLQTFVSVGCVGCHNGPLFGGNSFQKLGAVNAYKTDDQGRFAVTKDEADKFKFKVPSLRNIEITAPYFHDGSQTTLDGTVREMAWLQLGRKLTDQEVDDIVTFLHTLTDKSRTPTHTTSR
ncbi:Cytochrome-c peroxidase [Chthoniobacter flavus Ellin428]|uniref:Cytochrome-c peroxidase n=1 Tax=Chthoniobacter flavus Ellin428 TaxID=497964 RepID=B4D0E6_9BACT|nr:cytochrome c peroxidase [Chthoniobacter flavus]EDY19808.1 Cytochrome-c peroxidase [Chthoniobacter flavus Ellin428]TCO91918.1 cytochrome c peroxidase [Chthoniobacter flavus]